MGEESNDRWLGVPVGVELRVRLSTLLGLDEYPAEIVGMGYIHAEHARDIVGRQAGGQWRYVICDEHGVMRQHGLISRRPLTHPRRPPVRGAVIELQITSALLRQLAADPSRHPAWTSVITQIVDRSADTTTTDQDHDHDLGRRFPGAGLRRHVHVRDRRCAFPGCRMPAKNTDTDHITQYQHGGATTPANLISLCRHDHRLKDSYRWRITAAGTGLIRWTSPLGLVHHTRSDPVIVPLLEPAPRPCIRALHDDDDGPGPNQSDEPGHDRPCHDEPGHDEPGHDEPGRDEPDSGQPGPGPARTRRRLPPLPHIDETAHHIDAHAVPPF